MFRHLFSRFHLQHPDEVFFTAHSHHFWPDCTRDAMLRYWDDSARYVDEKWNPIFSEVISETQNLICERIGVSDPEQIVFAPNTHEFVCRLLSCFEQQTVSIVTTDSEFHSFRRQIQRLEESSKVTCHRVATAPIADFNQHFATAIKDQQPNLVFLSHVFFNSGIATPMLHDLINEIKPHTEMIVVDGYHSFCALDIDLSPIQNDIFYLSGGYKYAMAGEGACFMRVPTGCDLRPANTGWFAEFGELETQPDEQKVSYAKDGMRFAGATFDPSGIYRMRAALKMLNDAGLDQASLHNFVCELRDEFRRSLNKLSHPLLNAENLLFVEGADHGHFLTYELDNPQLTAQLAAELKKAKVHTDFRGSRIRFGFGIHQDLQYIAEGIERVAKSLANSQ